MARAVVVIEDAGDDNLLVTVDGLEGSFTNGEFDPEEATAAQNAAVAAAQAIGRAGKDWSQITL